MVVLEVEETEEEIVEEASEEIEEEEIEEVSEETVEEEIEMDLEVEDVEEETIMEEAGVTTMVVQMKIIGVLLKIKQKVIMVVTGEVAQVQLMKMVVDGDLLILLTKQQLVVVGDHLQLTKLNLQEEVGEHQQK